MDPFVEKLTGALNGPLGSGLTPVEKSKAKTSLRGSLTSLLVALTADANEVLSKNGFDPDDFVVCIYPFSIETISGEPVPEKALKALQAHYKKQRKTKRK